MIGFSSNASNEEARFDANHSSEQIRPFAIERYPEFNFTDIDSLYTEIVKKQRGLLGFFSVIATLCVLVLLYATLSLVFPTYEVRKVEYHYRPAELYVNCYSLFKLQDYSMYGEVKKYSEEDLKSRAYNGLFENQILPLILISGLVLFLPLMAFLSVRTSRKRWNILRDSDYIQVAKHSKYLFILKDNQFGLVDSSHKITVEPEYDYMQWHTKDKYLTVTKDHRTFVINMNGKEMC